VVVAAHFRTVVDGAASWRRSTACGRRFCGVRSFDGLGLGDRLSDVAGRVGRFAGCMAWKRSGVRFPLAPLQTRLYLCGVPSCAGRRSRRVTSGGAPAVT
jgi:hypothetical protein